ncbi:AGAP002040-PA-like protein [Anopheles sinensis]|uniref:AGAP002040-PA-like protein n=1 Tax=Anopheles sinensis TaxID=74873 RepID=A0A084VNN1_ANOSI|nr:AGAP002040-PA-like protein [Anopheles sinensis]
MEERQRGTPRQRAAIDQHSRGTPSHHNAERCRQRGCHRFQRIAASLVLCLALSNHLFPPTVASPFPQSANGAHHSHHHHQHQHHHQQSAQHTPGSGASGPSGHPYSGSSRSSGGSGGSGLGVYMIRSPESTIAPADDEVLFECELNLVPERLDWRFRAQGTPGMRKDYVYIGKNQAGYNVSTVDSRYKLRVSVSAATIGEYQCVAWFGASAIASIPARLTLATIGLEADQPPAAGGWSA